MIRINDTCGIDEDEVTFTYARSQGPGGQNVNKLATKVVLRFDVTGSRSLADEQRAAILVALRSRISKAGLLLINRSGQRSQSANRREALAAFVALLADALRPRRPRKRTKPTASAQARRLADKTARGRLKNERRLKYAENPD